MKKEPELSLTKQGREYFKKHGKLPITTGIVTRRIKELKFTKNDLELRLKLFEIITSNHPYYMKVELVMYLIKGKK